MRAILTDASTLQSTEQIFDQLALKSQILPVIGSGTEACDSPVGYRPGRNDMHRGSAKAMKRLSAIVLTSLCLACGAISHAEDVKSAEDLLHRWERTQNLVEPETQVRRTKSLKGVKVEVVVETESRENFDNIHFAFDSGRLEGETTFRQLDEIAKAMRDVGDSGFLIEGHTCDLGTESHNKGLSERRAYAVIKYLVAQGVRPSHLQGAGFGFERPAMPNTSEGNRAQNRRVQFFKKA